MVLSHKKNFSWIIGVRLVVKVKDLNHEHSLTFNSTKAMDRGCGSDKLTIFVISLIRVLMYTLFF
jgi:hypothetical protein